MEIRKNKQSARIWHKEMQRLALIILIPTYTYVQKWREASHVSIDKTANGQITQL